MILTFAVGCASCARALQRSLLAFRVPTSVGLFRGEDPTKVGTLYTAYVARAINRSLLRPLILRHVLINVFQLVIAIFDDCVHHVALVHHLGLVKD